MILECFVAQCFDGSTYDRRYRETFGPAIQAGGAVPIRADEAVGTKPIIEKIEKSLRKSTIAFAEISEDNPNVFLELGYAIALNLPVVIVCDKGRRDKLPFDIQHRPIIFYSTSAQSDFAKLQKDITENVRAALDEAKATRLRTSTSNEGDFSIDEVKRICLLELLDQDMRNPQGASIWEIQKSVVSHEISERMVTLALASLESEGLAIRENCVSYNDNEYGGISLSEKGKNLIIREYSQLMKEEISRNKLAQLSSVDRPNEDPPF